MLSPLNLTPCISIFEFFSNSIRCILPVSKEKVHTSLHWLPCAAPAYFSTAQSSCMAMKQRQWILIECVSYDSCNQASTFCFYCGCKEEEKEMFQWVTSHSQVFFSFFNFLSHGNLQEPAGSIHTIKGGWIGGNFAFGALGVILISCCFTEDEWNMVCVLLFKWTELLMGSPVLD